MGRSSAVVALLVAGLLVAGCGGGAPTDGLVTSSPTRAGLDVIVEDHSILYIEGAVGILQLVDGPADELGVRAAAFLHDKVAPGVWAGRFELIDLAPGEYVVRVWMWGCSAGGCGDDLEAHVEAARGRSNRDYSCETTRRLEAGVVDTIVAAIGPDGCIHIGPEPVDRPAARQPLSATAVDRTDATAVTSPFSADDRERLIEAALGVPGLPSDARVARLQPGFDADGVLSGAVVVLRHEAFSGYLDLPGLDLMEADGRQVAVPQVVRYTVESAVSMHVAVNLATGVVQWATPNARSVKATELVSRSDVDTQGRPVPPDARQLEGE